MTLERRISIATDGYRGGDGGPPTTVTVVINGSIRNAGLTGSVESADMAGSLGSNRLTGVLSDEEFAASVKDGLSSEIDNKNLDGELK